VTCPSWLLLPERWEVTAELPEHKQIALHNLDSLEASECCGEKHDVLVESVLAANYRVSEQGLLKGERKERDEWKERDLRRLERKCMKEDDSEVKSRFGREEGGREGGKERWRDQT
jgi:hypothetical protein